MPAIPDRAAQAAAGLLGDTPQRDYAEKLRLFNGFARPELCDAINALEMRPGSRVLDAGCGTGEAIGWLHKSIRGGGMVAGMDLSDAHVRAARRNAPAHALIVQGDMLKPPFAEGVFDRVWAVNAVNHLHDPVAGVRILLCARFAALVAAEVPQPSQWDDGVPLRCHHFYRWLHQRAERGEPGFTHDGGSRITHQQHRLPTTGARIRADRHGTDPLELRDVSAVN